MKKITFTTWQVHTLAGLIENREVGFTLGELRTLDKFLTKFEEVYQPFREKIAKLTEEKDLLKQQRDYDTLKSADGAKETAFELEDEQFNLLKSLWEDSKGFRGFKEIRKTVLEIDAKINGDTDTEK